MPDMKSHADTKVGVNFVFDVHSALDRILKCKKREYRNVFVVRDGKMYSISQRSVRRLRNFVFREL